MEDKMIVEMLLVLFWVLAIFFFSGLLGNGTEAIGQKFSIAPSVRGATLDAVGSSFAEFCTVIFALLAGSFEAGLGAIAGSALYNILVIPGASVWATGKDLEVKDKAVIKRDGFIYLAVVIGLILAIWLGPEASNGHTWHVIPSWVGLIGIAVYVAYVVLLVMQTKRDKVDETPEIEDSWVAWKVAGMVFVGIVGIGVACHFLVGSSLAIFRQWGIPDAVTGVTILAAATSLPDTLLSVFAARRGDADGAIANAIGSNSFDILICLGLPIFVVGGVQVDWGTSWVHLAFLAGSTVMALVFLFTDWKLKRWEGTVMIVSYVAFVIMAFVGIV